MSDDIPSLQPPSAAPTPPAPPTPPATDPEARNPMGEVWSEWIRPFLIVLLVVSTFRSAVADWNDVPTGSMKPTILPGERIFVNKVAYDLKIPFTRVRLAQWEDPRRGDVVVLFSPADGKRLVKRVVGLPGDVVALRSNRLYVNGEEAAYTEYDDLYLDELGYHPEMDSARVVSETVDGREHPVLWLPLNPNNATFAPTRVPPAQYFVMGDNRNQSSDSRVFGFVDRERIVGQATAVVVSIDKDGRFTPRWDRFFQGLP